MTKTRRGTIKHSGAFCLLAGTLIPALVMLIGFVIIKVWPFGDGTVLIIDSLHQYLPFYTDFHNKLVSGESLFYSFSGGFGYDFWSTFAYYLASPFNFLIALVPTPNVGDFMDLMILLKVSLCGGIFAWYLHRRDRQLFLPLVFGTMYALGNFLIGYYFNLMWLDSIAVLPLIMYGIEGITKGKGGALYGLSLLYALWCNYYIGFMLCIFSCLYLLACFAAREGLGIRQFLMRCVKFAWYSLLAGGTSAVLLLPAYLSLSASESMLSNSFPTSIRCYTDFLGIVYAHFAPEHPINISDSQVGLNAYCGVSVLMFVLLYLLCNQIPLREKLGKVLLALLLACSFAMNVLNYIWHGFHTQNGLPNRFAFLYVVVLLVMCYDVFPHLGTFKLPLLVLCGVVPIALSLGAALLGQLDFESYGNYNYITPILLAVYLLVLVTLTLGGAGRRMRAGVLGALMLAEAVAHGIYGIEYNENVTRSIYLEDQESFRTLVKEADPEGFYRSEIDRTRMRNVGIFSGAHSVVMFNSTMPESVTDFCDHIGMEARTNKNGYVGVTRLMNDVFGIRYVLSAKGKGDALYGLKQVGGDDNLKLYYNPNALSVGFMVHPEIRFWDTGVGSPIDIQNDFVNLATGLEDLYLLDRTVEAKDGEDVGIKVPQGKQVYVYLPARVDDFSVKTPEYNDTYKTYNDHLYVVNALGDEDTATVTPTLKSSQDSATVQIFTCSDADYQAVQNALSRDQLQDVHADGNTLSGHVDVHQEGILLLTVPYDQDWRIQVDGQNISPLRIGGMLTGIELTQGDHEIAMTYIPGGIKIGFLITLLCGGLLLLTIALGEMRKTKKEMQQMNLRFSRKAQAFAPGIFTRLNERKEAMLAQGRTIYNLSVGTPDFPTPDAVMQAVSDAAKRPENYKYSLRDLPELKTALQSYYQQRYGVHLEENEMMSIYGSQEGMAHIAWALCDPGDLVLVPNPGYPIFKIGPELCGAKTWEYPLLAENDYLPVLEDIPEEICARARFMVVNYPGNPLCKAAPDAFYEKLIAFARANEIIIIHDNAYSDIIFGGRRGKSFLSFEGAKEVGAEFYSLSKSFDYTGARMSFLVGNAQIVEKFQTIRSQIDYGIFLPVQYGAIAALSEPEDAVRAQCAAYEERMRTLCEGLRSIGWDCPDSEGTMFVWAPLPARYDNAEAFVVELMEKSGVICTPGSSFGSLGEGYVRFALVLPPKELTRAVEAIRSSGILSYTGTRDHHDTGAHN